MKAPKHRGAAIKELGRRSFFRDREGAAALEFALLAIPFIVLLTAILETGLIFMAQQVLQTATTQSARLIMTGQAQAKAMTKDTFASAVVANGQNMFGNGVVVNVQTFSTFSGMSSPPAPLTNGSLDKTKATFSMGNPGDIELVQVYYQWPVITGLPGLNMATNGNTRLLQATAVFRNEPY